MAQQFSYCISNKGFLLMYKYCSLSQRKVASNWCVVRNKQILWKQNSIIMGLSYLLLHNIICFKWWKLMIAVLVSWCSEGGVFCCLAEGMCTLVLRRLLGIGHFLGRLIVGVIMGADEAFIRILLPALTVSVRYCCLWGSPPAPHTLAFLLSFKNYYWRIV